MKPVRMIIVEDEPAILQGIERLVSRMELPLAVVGVYTKGQEALDDLYRVEPDIVMTDVQMPMISGLQLIDKIKESGYHAEYLILSGYSEFKYVQQAIKLSVENYLLKPPHMKELKESLAAICHKVQEEQYVKLRNILENYIFQRYGQEEELMNLNQEKYRVYVYHIGPYLEWGIEDVEFHAGHFHCGAELEKIRKEQGTDYPDLWILNGYYPNMKIVITLNEISHGVKFYQRLKSQAEQENLYITFAVSGEKRDFQDIRKTVQDCTRFLRNEMKFGVSQMLAMNEKDENSKEKSSPRADRDALYQAIETEMPVEILKRYQEFSSNWEENQCTQMLFLQITKEFLKDICNKLFHSQNTDIEEDALQQVNLIAFQAGNYMEFVRGIEKLIQDIYASFGEGDSDCNVENIVEKLWNYINSTYREGIDVNEFARKNGYHPVYLITQFSKSRGISPTKRMIQLRMQQACELLTTSDLSLKTIGESVGYGDVSYFSRTFKEHEGVSPSVYRKQQEES